MTGEQYKELPSHMKIDMRKCDCSGDTALFYDEDKAYHVECTDCKCVVKFKANSMKQAKNVWNYGRYISDDNLIDLMKHAIGLDYKKPYTRHGKKFYKPYRNYFNTDPEDKEWIQIMNSGCACMGSIKHCKGDGYEYDSVNFYLTRVGMDRLGKYLFTHIYDIRN